MCVLAGEGLHISEIATSFNFHPVAIITLTRATFLVGSISKCRISFYALIYLHLIKNSLRLFRLVDTFFSSIYTSHTAKSSDSSRVFPALQFSLEGCFEKEIIKT